MGKNSIQLITFKVGDSVYAVDIQSVREVVEARNIVSLPNESPYIEGIMNLRGKIVTLISLSKILGIDSSLGHDGGSRQEVLVGMNDGEGAIGFIVDRVIGVLRVSKSDMEKPPLTSSEVIEGVVKHGDKLIIVLNLSKLSSNIKLG